MVSDREEPRIILRVTKNDCVIHNLGNIRKEMFIEVTDEFIFHMNHLKCPWIIQIESIDTKSSGDEALTGDFNLGLKY